MPAYIPSLAELYTDDTARIALSADHLFQYGGTSNYDELKGAKVDNNGAYGENAAKIYGGSTTKKSYSKMERFKDLGVPVMIVHYSKPVQTDAKLCHALHHYSDDDNQSSMMAEDRFSKMFETMMHGSLNKLHNKVHNKVHNKMNKTKSKRQHNTKGTKRRG